MLSCRDVTRLVSDAQEKPLGLQDRMSMRMHLLLCLACRNFEEQMATIRSAMRNLAKSELPSDPESKPER